MPDKKPETWVEKVRRETPWYIWHWIGFKLRVTEFLAKYLNIHLDW